MWTIDSNDCLREFIGHTDCIYYIDLTSDSKYILSASRDKSIKFWDLNSGQCLKTIKQDNIIEYVKSISKDLIAFGCNSINNNLKIYDLKRNQVIREFVGHSNSVNRLELLQNGNLLSVSQDSTIKLWKI